MTNPSDNKPWRERLPPEKKSLMASISEARRQGKALRKWQRETGNVPLTAKEKHSLEVQEWIQTFPKWVRYLVFFPVGLLMLGAALYLAATRHH